MWIAMNYAYEVPEADLRAAQDKLVAQDIAIVESQRPQCLPLDLQAPGASILAIAPRLPTASGSNNSASPSASLDRDLRSYSRFLRKMVGLATKDQRRNRVSGNALASVLLITQVASYKRAIARAVNHPSLLEFNF
ncbi:MAG TPA: hypothetical protein DCY88_08065 [Cyanobacteria bacterium UBA11372]|nr:hypothetical protein [Cyanobacteria bacterium UBA11372]